MSLDRLYSLIEARVGFSRTRDGRLELLATERALEARHEVGLSGASNITHPVNQLKARTWPLQATYKSVFENAAWNYGYADPVARAAESWWNSEPHRYNFQRTEATHWGLGIYTESGRWYFIAVLTRDLEAMTPRRVYFDGGEHTGHHFSASGEVLESKTAPLARPSGASYDLRWHVPGKGPHLRIVNGMYRTWWMPESSRVYPVSL